MTVTRNFYTTKDLGRLHIADEHSRYGGSVNLYNNFITKLITQLLGIGLKTNFNGKTYIVNRRSYEKFLIRQGIKVFPNPQLYQHFNQVMLQAQESWKKNPYIRQKLSYQKSFRLFKKMVVAMRSSNVERTQQLANKGANLDAKFWERNHGYGLSFNHDPAAEIDSYEYNFKATQFSPILWAAKNKNSDLVAFFQGLGAHTGVQGETSKFNRRIVDVENRMHIHPTFVSFGYRRRHGLIAFPSIHESTYVRTEDHKQRMFNHRLDNHLNYVSIKCGD